MIVKCTRFIKMNELIKIFFFFLINKIYKITRVFFLLYFGKKKFFFEGDFNYFFFNLIRDNIMKI